MKVRHVKVEVTLNKMSKHEVTVPEWELPVLQAQWGSAVVILDDNILIDRKLPEPNDEFARLAQRYGPKHEETPYIAGVYGNFGPGVNALRTAIIESTKERLEMPVEPNIAPLAAGSEGATGEGSNEGGDPEDFADLTGDATENAEAVA